YLIVGQLLLLEVEAIERLALLAKLRLHQVAIASGDDVEGLMRRRLHTVGHQHERSGQGQATKAHIGKINLPVKLDPQQHMPTRCDALTRHIPAPPRRQPRYLKAQGTQDGEQEQILLEAVATSPALDEIVLERGEIQAHGLMQQRCEIFKRDDGRMPQMDGLQGCQSWGALTSVANALEVGVQVKLLFRQSMRHSVSTFHAWLACAARAGAASDSLLMTTVA